MTEIILSVVAQATEKGGGSPAEGGGGALFSFLPFIVIIVIVYFMLIKPQQKQSKQHQNFLGTMKRGDVVVTNGGMIGKVVEIGEDEVTLEFLDSKAKFLKGSITGPRVKQDKASAQDRGKKAKE